MQNQSAAAFARGVSTVLPTLFAFFAPDLRRSPLPTNSFFQNFVLGGDGALPEYIHPYLVRSNGSSLSLCYPSRTATAESIQQDFSPQLSISAGGGGRQHVVSAFDDLSVTLDLPPALRFFLVRGSPYITCFTTLPKAISISADTKDPISSVTPDDSNTKHKVQLQSGRTFLVYSSSPLHFSLSSNPSSTLLTTTEAFNGVLRFAYLPDTRYEPVLDRFSGCYPVSGDADITRPFSVGYRWGKQGTGDLLLLAHPLHIRLLSRDEGGVKKVLRDFIYHSIDGHLVGVVGDSWILKTDPIPVAAWNSTRGVTEEGRREVISALRRDVQNLTSPIPTNSSYFYGKAIARAARLAAIAEEVGLPDVIPAVKAFLEGTVTPWLDGSFQGNGFLYEPSYRGLTTRLGLHDPDADFGFGIYNDHHFHLGYFLYAIAVLSKLNPAWGRTYMPQAYAMVGDFMNLDKNNPQSNYTRLRNFDLWKLHSWAAGLKAFADGRNQESTSEAVNAYHSAALVGLSYGDAELAAAGGTLAALEIQSAVTWWHVKEGEGMYEDVFSGANRVVGVLWANKRESRLWFAPPGEKEKRLGIQVLPLLPMITEVLFGDAAFARELVDWASPALQRQGITDGWKGFVYALEGIYDKQSALERTRQLGAFDDGNSLSNMLWWLHSR